MKNILKYSFLFIFASFAMVSCGDYTLPEAGSIPDETPPSAGFAYEASEANFLEIRFSNTSISATDYEWDFGNGQTSTDKNPTVLYETAGTYLVMLTVSDKLNQSSTTSKEVIIEEPIVDFTPVILEPSFEDNSLPDGTGDGRDSWRTDLGGVIQITSSPVFDGSQAAKFPSAGDRVAWQAVTVLPNLEYNLSFYYTMNTDAPGSLTVSILDTAITDLADTAGATIASKTVNDQTDASTYVKETITFNAGDNSQIYILITNLDVECRVDLVEFE